MKEIYLLSRGDNISKIKYEQNVEIELVKSKDKIFDYDYVNLTSGTDDVMVVRNYYPYFIYNVKKGDTLIDLMSRGFDVNVLGDISEGDKIILHKPKSIRYIVKPLETLDSIATMFGVDKFDIISTNKLLTEKLFIGQILWI